MDEVSLKLPVVWKWGKRVGFSILDQGLFSGANFLLNILLARWLTPEEYGAFAVAFSGFLISFGFYNSLILDPLMVFGSTKSESIFPDYIKKMMLLQTCINISIFVILFLIGVVSKGSFRTALIGMSVYTPLVLSIWFLRSIFYVNFHPRKATAISLIYSVLLLGTLIALGVSNQLTLLVAFICLSTSGAITTILGLLFIISLHKKQIITKVITWKEFIFETWKYSRWILVTTAFDGIAYLAYPPLVSVLIGVDEAGAFKGIQNFVNPIQQYFVAVYLLIMPILSKRKGTNDYYIFHRSFIVITLIPTIIYTLFILIFPSQVISFIYNNSFYQNFVWIVPYFSLFSIILWGRYITTTFIRAEKTSISLLYGKIGALGMFFLSLIPLWIWRKMEFVIASMLLVSMVELMVLLYQHGNNKAIVVK